MERIFLSENKHGGKRAEKGQKNPNRRHRFSIIFDHSFVSKIERISYLFNHFWAQVSDKHRKTPHEWEHSLTHSLLGSSNTTLSYSRILIILPLRLYHFI